MCLYAALSVAVAEAVQTRSLRTASGGPFNDWCPRWTAFPSLKYRLAAAESGIRRPRDWAAGNTDSTIFDPRLWDHSVESYFRQLLKRRRPRVVLLSTVSPAYRYAAVIMRVVKEVLPDATVMLGGRHMDETIRYDEISADVAISESSVVRDIQEGDLEPCVDLILSGECYYTLPLALKAVSLAMPIDGSTDNACPVRPAAIIAKLQALACQSPRLGGRSVITVMEGKHARCFPIIGPPTDLEALPSPYAAFAIRARFPVFPRQTRTPCVARPI